MEQEKEKKRISVKDEGQKFYFDKDGRLVVESNKGVWVDGEKYVKMYGNFSCNAKTMGEIIHQLKGIAVETGVHEKIRVPFDSVVDDILNIHEHNILHYCVLGADSKRVEEYEKELAKHHCESNEIARMNGRVISLETALKETSRDFNRASDEVLACRKAIESFNRLPWWKRMFKKIEVK